MLFSKIVMDNLVLTKLSCPKGHAVAFTAPIFVGFFVCHTNLSRGGRQIGWSYLNRAKNESRQKASVYSPIVGLTDTEDFCRKQNL